jgi:hypothetical protein
MRPVHYESQLNRCESTTTTMMMIMMMVIMNLLYRNLFFQYLYAFLRFPVINQFYLAMPFSFHLGLRLPQWPHGLRRGPVVACFLELWVLIPPRVWMSLVNVTCCRVEVSATSRSLIQRSPTECNVTECTVETSTMMMPRSTRDSRATGGGGGSIHLWNTDEYIIRKQECKYRSEETILELSQLKSLATKLFAR